MSMSSGLLCRTQGEIGRQRLIVALEGDKASTDKTGIAPLAKALRDLIGFRNDVLVLVILNVKLAEEIALSYGTDSSTPFEECPHIKFLLQEVSKRKEHYRRIFRPFHDRCKSIDVKFQLKVSAGCQPRDIIIEQANITKATSIVIDRCFARDMISPRSSDTDCSISLVGEDEETMILKYLALNDGSGTCSAIDQVISYPDISDLTKESLSLPESQLENPTVSEPYEVSNIYSQKLCDDLTRISPVQLSEETVAVINGGPMKKISANRQDNSETYAGLVPEDQSQVMVKRLKGDSGRVLEAEKKAALCMCHNNILGLRGYHTNEDTTVLVFPFPRGTTLDDYLYGSRVKEVGLTFVDKMKIAIGIAKGIRYMHEECPRGPVAHGDLKPHNIILGHHLNPQISNFGRATWLHHEQSLQFTNKRYPDKYPSDNPSMALVKLDILSFGVLLLRLFCRKHVPRDDKKLVKWAQPLLEERAYHKLLDEDAMDVDMYGIYRVMTAATRCTKIRPSSRPSISEVISILRGESSCAVQGSPSTESSVT